MQKQREREEKWTVDGDFALPRIDDLMSGADVYTDTVELASTYYDTSDYDLRAHGIVMRLRNGDTDIGWQVKLPSGSGRLELHWPPSDTLPDELARALNGAALGKPIASVVTIRTSRRRHRVTSGGTLRFEVADDAVRASSGEALLAWREVEVEVGPSVSTFPKKLRRRLRAAGAHPSAYPSKLAHATGMPTPRALSAAASALTDYLNEQVDQVILGDVELRRGRDPIHDTRVAIRRIRSVLRVFKHELTLAAEDFDIELKWFAGVLGDVRDAQVQQRRFAAALDALPDELILGPVRSRVRSDLQAIELPARNAVDDAMQTTRYLDILTELRRWRTDPPIAAQATAKRLRHVARRASRKAHRKLVHAVDGEAPDLLHRARKAAKRARYAAELVAPLDATAKKRRKHHKKIQSVLGDYQDTVVATAALRRMASAAGTLAGENGFTYGLLYAREEGTAADCRTQARRLATPK
jgi:CHAD domain-containing protein